MRSNTDSDTRAAEDGYRLCYAESPWAKFTTAADFEMLRTDDFDDRYRSGSVYETEEYDLLTVAIDGPVMDANYGVSPDDINDGGLAWLKTESWADEPLDIRGKVGLGEFIEQVQKAGGEVYLPAGFGEDGEEDE